jgi:anti-sigma regulatory factor (Ser/Thr protein kinase)
VITRPAVPSEPRVIRGLLREWLLGWAWPDDDLDDLVTAVDEAVSNVIDHAYRLHPAPGDIHLQATITTDADQHNSVTVAVTDQGRWRPVPHDSGFRGRGLRMMSACTASLHIDRGIGGTTVTMTTTAAREPIAGS